MTETPISDCGAEPTARPRLSVIIPLLAPDDEFLRCVHSIKSVFHDCREIEVIVVVPPLQHTAISNLMPWANVLQESRKGIYAAMNDGVAAAAADFVYFIGKDDIVLPPLRRMLTMAIRRQADAVFAAVYWGGAGIYAPVTGRYRILKSNSCHQGIIYSRRLFGELGPFVRQMRYQADHYFNIKLLWSSRPGFSVEIFPEPVAWYSGTGASERARDEVFRRLLPAIYRRYLGCWAVYLLVIVREVKRWRGS